MIYLTVQKCNLCLYTVQYTVQYNPHIFFCNDKSMVVKLSECYTIFFYEMKMKCSIDTVVPRVYKVIKATVLRY